MNTHFMAIGVDEWGNVWEYKFPSITDASMFIDAVGESQGCTWHIKEMTDSVWSVDEAVEHFTQ
jgi:hypothetical protein